ncbi:MAG: PAS domain-containing protein [Spirochaetales bacterium]|nr:PAS domain-containing protein [Spirochaetales bacterium]
MKLRNKLFLSLFFVLLIQIALLAAIVFLTFLDQISLSTDQELETACQEASMMFEQLKNRLYNSIHFLSFLINDLRNDRFTPYYINLTLNQFFSEAQTDKIYFLNEQKKLIAQISNPTRTIPDILHLLDVSKYRFTRNSFIYTETNLNEKMLILITGRTIRRRNNKKYYLFFINSIEARFLDSVLKNGDLFLALFLDDDFMCSNLPPFTISDDSKELFHLSIAQTPYRGFKKVIAYDLPGRLTLVTLKSQLEDQIRLDEIRRLFVMLFFVTLIASFFIAAGITTPIISPFFKLNYWLKAYLETGKTQALNLHSKDETGFLARTVYSMVNKLIKEEQIIKNQLKEITFLNKYNDLVVRNLQAGVIIVDKSGLIEYANPYFYSLIGVDQNELNGKDILKVFKRNFDFPNHDNETLIINLKQEGHISNIHYGKADSELIKFVAKIMPLAVPSAEAKTLIVVEDITKTEHLWEKILISEKIAALGLISAGMAHEINNPLGSILSHVNYLKAVEKKADKLDSIGWIESETKRISAIIQQVLNFARKGDAFDEIDVNSHIYQIVDLLHFELKKKNITVTLTLGEQLPKARMDSDSFKQVVINILMNAEQALAEGGQIIIITARVDGFIHITIRDSGSGIATEDLAKVFDPFFTTKSDQKGIGLGLSISYSIVERAGGEMDIHTEQGSGTEVTIKLPVYEP